MIRKIEIQKFVSTWKKLYHLLFDYIESDKNSTEQYHNLINQLEEQKIGENKEQLTILIHLISNISYNYHSENDFFSKIQQILIYYANKIKQTYSNSEIFIFFRKSKPILLFLFQSQIITVDESIINLIFAENNAQRFSYHIFFYPEIKSFIESAKITFSVDSEILTNFESKRINGQNESYLCQLIQNDLIDDFVIFANKTNLSLSETTIKPSAFETNSFLIEREKTTLIEYAAFYGSIQIFQYLRMNQVELKPSLWLYAIHSKNCEMLNLLENFHLEPPNNSFEDCLKESIKCHFNDIADYIQNNLMLSVTDNSIDNIKFDKNVVSYSFHYYNFKFFPDDLNQKFIFYYACRYDYFTLVKLLMSTSHFNIYPKIIQNNFFSYQIISKK